MGKYPIRLIGTPVVPGDLDYDMDPPEWHTPWKEWARDQLYPRDYDALCDGLWW